MREEDLIKTRNFGILDRVGHMFVGTPEQRQALIKHEGEALQQRYQDCEDSFLRLLDISGADIIDDERRSPDIVIGEAVERVGVFNYQGTWKAAVTEVEIQRRRNVERGRPVFRINAWFVPDDGTILTRVNRSDIPRVKEHFGMRFAFSEAAEVGWTRETLERAVDSYGTSVDRAEETLGMLWAALSDPGRNYQLALKRIGL